MVGYVEIFEVGPRDGLQNEARQIPTREKIALVDCHHARAGCVLCGADTKHAGL